MVFDPGAGWRGQAAPHPAPSECHHWCRGSTARFDECGEAAYWMVLKQKRQRGRSAVPREYLSRACCCSRTNQKCAVRR